MSPVKLSLLGAALLALAGGTFFLVRYDAIVTIPAAQKTIAAKLRDPDATQFRESRLAKNDWLCGELNGKNGSGGYVGFRKFASRSRTDEYYLEGEGRLGEATTEDMIAVLEKKIAYRKQFASLREDNPNLRPLSESEVDDRARSQLFDDKWAEVCQ